jgi:hypothetical protein
VVRRCQVTAHKVLLRHPWAAALAESRVLGGPARLGYYDALLGVLRHAGFSEMGAFRANLVLDSYVYGFTLQEVSWPASPDGPSELAATFVGQTPRDRYPNLVDVAMLAAEGRIDIGSDFEIGLDAVLDSLGRIRDAG